MLDAMLAAFGPFIPWLIAFAVVAVIATAPLPTRSVGERRRDIWRGFRFESRRRVMGRAGGRCESASLVFWLRCPDAAVEADHVYPWSKGGATTISNGQALCSGHNRAKSSMTPPWWYVLLLERRRRRYFPTGEDVRVFATMTSEDLAARETWQAKRSRR